MNHASQATNVDVARREHQVVVAWRAKRLASLGVRPQLALAETVDWHELTDLLARGCPPALALEILR